MLILVDHKNKKIYPIDLKTSGHPEWDFYYSFLHWNYAIQARLYWRIIRDNLDKSEEFREYSLDDYRFIVINKKTLTPLVWIFDDTKKFGTLTYGKENQIKLKDPFEIGEELSYYISSKPVVPNGINVTENNNIIKWLNKI